MGAYELRDFNLLWKLDLYARGKGDITIQGLSLGVNNKLL